MHHDPDQSSSKAVHLNFDEASYPPDSAPCQVLAYSFYSSGLSYCCEVSPGVLMPISKKSLRLAMEAGMYAWVSDLEPKFIKTGSGVHFKISMSATASSFKPLINNQFSLVQAFRGKELFDSFRNHNCKSFRYDQLRQGSSNVTRVKRDKTGLQSAKRKRDGALEGQELYEAMERGADVFSDASRRAKGY